MGAFLISVMLLGSLQAQADPSPALEATKCTSEIPKPEGCYKTFFIQKGLGASTHSCPPLMRNLDQKLGLGYEYFDEGRGTWDEQVIRSAECFIGVPGTDDNGRLLYPDGAPRFALMFINGGSASAQAGGLGEEGRKNFLKFYEGGGSVMGSCAGGWLLATKSWKGTHAVGVWPGQPNWAQLGSTQLDLKLEKDCPLLKYDDFGGDLIVSSVRYNKGPYFNADPWPAGTEILSRYFSQNEELLAKMKKQNRIDKVETLAYKKNDLSGRAILCGAHPEGSKDPNAENYRYFNALVHYAYDGRGAPRVKAELKSSETRLMTDNKLAGHEKIGDLQYHHFTIKVPENTKKLGISLAGLAKENGNTTYNLDLHLKLGGFAFLSGEPSRKSTGEGSEEKIILTNPPPGTWYVAVVCKDTVAAETGSPFVYSGKTGVLNGVAYSIRVDVQ